MSHPLRAAHRFDEFIVLDAARHESYLGIGGGTVADLDAAWDQDIINSDQFVQIVYLTLERYALFDKPLFRFDESKGGGD
jgi:hypothetical protein